MNENSLQNYIQLKEEFVNDKEKVYQIICKNPWGITLKQIAMLMSVEPHQISGRITTLKAEGRIKVYAKNRRPSYRNPKKTITEDILIKNYENQKV